jgi:predicted GNAT family acetyltransferase
MLSHPNDDNDRRQRHKMMDLKIEHLPGRGRFQALVAGQACVADYRLGDGVLAITHTEVPPPLEGRGIAGELVQAVIDHARAQGLKVRPLCSFARAYMRRHPDTADVLA